MDRRTTVLISLICAIAVGNMYYAQPVLVEIAQAFSATPSAVGTVAMLAQIGYGLSVLVLVPLGDVVERRRLVLTLLGAVSLAMAAAGCAQSLVALAAANLAIGMCSVTPQILIPYAATLATEKQRATVIGTVQSGLLIGILLARTFAGVIAAAGGWRSVFFVGAGMSCLLALLVASRLPAQPVRGRMALRALFASMWQLFRDEPILRRASCISGLNFAAFSAFWTSLAFLLAEHYGLGPAAVGLFGIVGVAGALGASVAGRAADCHGPRVAQAWAAWLTVASFALFFGASHSMVVLVAGVVLMDAGVQAAHLALQAEIFTLQAEARSRLNGIYMFWRFAGGALGSAVGAWAYNVAHWPGVCAVGLMFSLAAAALCGLASLAARDLA